MKSCANSLSAIIISGFIIAFTSCNTHQKLPPDILTSINDFVSTYAKTNNFSGNILIASGDDIVFHNSYGMSNREHAVPVKRETVFYIASLSKTFTAAAILNLKERGLLNLDDQLSSYIPDYPNGKGITIRHLLLHTSGIPRIFSLPDYEDIARQEHSVREMVEFMSDSPLIHEPGARRSYSGPNYHLLAYIVEIVSGMEFEDYIQEYFLTPLSMNSTGIHTSWRQLVPNRASGYDPVNMNDLVNSAYHDYSIDPGSGSMYSTSSDLLSWVTGLISGKVLKPETIDEMFSNQFDIYGYGWLIWDFFGHRVFSINGWSNTGFSACISHYPDEQLSIIILNNIDISSVAGEIGDGISAILLNEEVTFPTFTSGIIRDDLADNLVGVYQFGDDFYVPGSTMTIVNRDGMLYTSEPDGSFVGLLSISENEYIHRSSWGRVQFELDDTGEVKRLFFYDKFWAVKK